MTSLPAGTGVVQAGRGLQTLSEEHHHAPTRYTRSTHCGHLPSGASGEGAARPTPRNPIWHAQGPQGHRGDARHLSWLPHTASGGALSTDWHRISGLFCLGSVVHLWSEASQGVCPAQKEGAILHGYLCLPEL